MTLSTTTSRATYAGNGVTTIFSFPYRFLVNGDLEVTLVDADGVATTQVLTTNYTVTGADLDAGGSVTMIVAPAVGQTLVIRRVVDLTQETDYNSGDAFPAETHERALDKLTMMDQQLQEQVDRSITVPLDNTTFSGQLPEIVAGRFVRVNDSGTGLEFVTALDPGELVVSPFIETLLDDANAAAARTTLGAQVAGNYATSGANSNITSLSGLTTPLSLAQGGVGVTTAFEIRALIGADRGIQPITATVAANALTLTLNPTVLDFRSTTLGSGAVNTRTVSSAITLTVSSGSTLGTSNGVISRLAVLAMDNAGTVELAVVNLLGGVNIDESGLISTTAEGGAGGADSASTIYSTAARASLPFRIIGFVESTQATAGTWATTPSLVNGSGSPYAMWLAGYGQTIQNVSGSRALNGGPYTNNTGRRIKVYVSAIGNASADIFMTSTINSVTTNRASLSYQESGTWRFIYNSLAFDVPPGGTYAVATNNTSTLSLWTEDR